MCDPVSLTIAATVAAAAATGVQGISAYNQDKYEAGVARNNAVQADAAAKDALERGQQTDIEHYMRVSQLKGQQLAAASASGVDTTMGSPLATAQETSLLAQRDAGTILENAGREAHGYSINAENYRAEASAKNNAAGMQLVSTALNMGSTVLGGAQQTSSAMDRYGRPAWWPTGGRGGGGGGATPTYLSYSGG